MANCLLNKGKAHSIHPTHLNASTQEQKLHLGVLLENMFRSGSGRAGDGEVEIVQWYSLWMVFDRHLGRCHTLLKAYRWCKPCHSPLFLNVSSLGPSIVDFEALLIQLGLLGKCTELWGALKKQTNCIYMCNEMLIMIQLIIMAFTTGMHTANTEPDYFDVVQGRLLAIDTAEANQ